MRAEVIAIGDEMTSGQRLDTNSQWLSQRLEDLGIRVLFHSTVGDDLPANIGVFRNAFQRAEIIVCTGGLGPTADDLTRQALSEATGRPLIQDDGALEHIRQLFARRRRPMPERNTIQAMFPAGSRVIPNPHGSAPGIDLEVTRDDGVKSRLFALPGVPAEMREMWEATVGPALLTLQGRPRVIRHHCLKCFGIGESDLEAMLPDMIQRGREPRVGITVSKATITLRITAEAATPEECENLIGPTAHTIRECLKDLVFGEGDREELQHAVIRELLRQSKSLAVVECGPGGTLADWLNEACHVLENGDVRAHPYVTASDYHRPFRGGLVLAPDYASDLQAHAQQIREQFNADMVLTVGAFPANDAESPGSVPLGYFDGTDYRTDAAPFSGHPDILKARATKHALHFLLNELTAQAPASERQGG